MSKQKRRSRSHQQNQGNPAEVEPKRHERTAEQECPRSASEAAECFIRLVPREDEIQTIGQYHRAKDATQDAAPARFSPGLSLVLIDWLDGGWPEVRLRKKHKDRRDQEQPG